MPALGLPDMPEWQELTDSLKLASKTPPKQRPEKVSIVVDQICDLAFQHGLPQASLETVIDIVTRKTYLDQTSVTNLIKNLYPSGKIRSAAVIRIVSGFGEGVTKPSPSTQGLLLRWLTIVHGIIDDSRLLSKFYNILFNLLDMITLRAPLCHLLSTITRRRHVKPFRIQQLLELVSKVGNEPAVIGLLRVFKDYYPDIIIGNLSSGRGSMPPQLDNEWLERLSAIESSTRRGQTPGLIEQNRFKVSRNFGRQTRNSIVPDVHTSQANESSVTLEEVDGVDDFVDRLENIELPNQVISSLQDPLLQKYMAMVPDELAQKRIELWLFRYLSDELSLAQDGLPESPHFPEMLQWLHNQTVFSKTILPIVNDFLERYLLFWDGTKNVQAILGILEYLPIQPFPSLHETYLQPLEVAAAGQSSAAFEVVLLFLRNLLRRWRSIYQFQQEPDGLSYSEFKGAYEAVIEHANELILTSISSAPFSSRMSSIAISFYEALAVPDVENKGNPSRHIPIVFPPVLVAYHILFSSSLSDVSRYCSILGNSKKSFETLKSAVGEHYPSQYTRNFNGQLMDTCNLLWRNRALNSTDANAAGCLCPPATTSALQAYMSQLDREYSLALSFGISHNSLLTTLSIAVFRALEDEAEANGKILSERQAGPVTQRALTLLEKRGGLAVSYKLYRVDVLKWLQERGLGGIKDLMFSTMVNLKDNSGG